MTFRLVFAALSVTCLLINEGLAQTDPRGKVHTVHGTVESVNDYSQSIRLNQEKIPGYSDARIATYNVNDTAILRALAVGDRIDATIYEKDDTLYSIHIVVTDDRLIPLPKR